MAKIMTTLIPCIVFPGTCKEAVEFYKDAIDGEITLMLTYGESPVPVTKDLENRIFNADLRAGQFHIKASDDLPAHPVSMGTNISLYMAFPDKKTKKMPSLNCQQEEKYYSH